ncbi:hypothetical protein ADK47_30545 [Streptomyces rimosus subsp. rimosus]|uniref:Uncharacterized protein n=2 Tax=Streptomyces TaxID=1883 RepID=A0ABY3ZGB1_STRRM|nr:hypothetical protein ADK78_31105 [Kitasatospora aureofaciens]KOT30738.1 hypothetical protein ADK84_31755 [Streptomyces sp. NRRL WC-3701]KOT55488.1 hypothetical protein ADK45_28875 [Streptomyces rimosus subsp. rimosus]KOT71921.1 hypothetical protein ADK47_30545 [Streptomyces rimosus subsp. rimosus]UNZ08520.1 hypothetical protein SRIMR7_40865 [Streptomyces rimosus subsp. rimosus]
MSRRKVPYGLMFDQNSAVRPRRSSGVSFFAHFDQDLLGQQCVDVHERGLEQVQREHGCLGVLLVRKVAGRRPSRRTPRSGGPTPVRGAAGRAPAGRRQAP